MTLPLVSVIVPSFNNEGRIGFALQSVITQDYENLEIIFVNDASTDDTLKNAEEVLKNSSRSYKIINHEKNRGVSAARNTGIDAANGEYICFCDGDDLMKENLVSTLVALCLKYDCDISFGGYIWRFENGEPDLLCALNFDIPQPIKGEDALYMSLFKRGFMIHLCGMIFKKSFLEKINLRFTEGCISGEDTEFKEKALCRAEKVSFTPECLYIYFLGSESGTVTAKSSKERQITRLNVNVDSDLRTIEYLLKHVKSRRIKFLIKNSHLPEIVRRRYVICVNFKQPEKYAELLKNKELKKILLRSFKTIFFNPKVFLKVLPIFLAPKLYYLLRKEQ